MSGKRRHAVVILPRPANWQPENCRSVPDDWIYARNVTLGDAAEIARQHNLKEFDRSTGMWCLPVKCLARNSSQPRIVAAKASVILFFRGRRFSHAHHAAMSSEAANAFAAAHNQTRAHTCRAVAVDAICYATLPELREGGAA